MAFEFTAESYRASAGYSSVDGKNHWHYGGLHFVDSKNAWEDEDGCSVTGRYLMPGNHPAVRTWIAPHKGRIRIEGSVRIPDEGRAGMSASIIHRSREAWSFPATSRAITAAHDFALDVEEGDQIDFVVKRGTGTRA